MRTMTLGLADRYRCCHGAWGVLRLCVSSGSSTYGFICDRVRENPVSFVFGNASPDAVRLSKPQRVFEALNADGALGAESFGVLYTLAAFDPTFTLGVEEHRGICSAATGQQAPTPGLSVPDDRRSRCDRSAALACPNLIHGRGGAYRAHLPTSSATPTTAATGTVGNTRGQRVLIAAHVLPRWAVGLVTDCRDVVVSHHCDVPRYAPPLGVPGRALSRLRVALDFAVHSVVDRTPRR
jgi:hypothetical protein